MPKRIPTKPVQPNQSIEWGINCLMELTTMGRPVTCKEMSERLGVEKTKASRLLGTLAYLGMAERLQDLSYIPGPGIHVLSAMSLRGSGLLRHALPHIRRMKRKWDVDARLGVLWRDQVSYLYHSVGRPNVGDAIAGGALWPAARSTVGRVLLAQKTDEEIRAILGNKVDEQELGRVLGAVARVRDHGFLRGAESVTLPIGAPAVAALAFKGEADRMDNPKLVEEAGSAVDSIAQALGTGGRAFRRRGDGGCRRANDEEQQ